MAKQTIDMKVSQFDNKQLSTGILKNTDVIIEIQSKDDSKEISAETIWKEGLRISSIQISQNTAKQLLIHLIELLSAL
jgi:hypothetical protein